MWELWFLLAALPVGNSRIQLPQPSEKVTSLYRDRGILTNEQVYQEVVRHHLFALAQQSNETCDWYNLCLFCHLLHWSSGNEVIYYLFLNKWSIWDVSTSGAICRELTSTCILNELVRSLHTTPDHEKKLTQLVLLYNHIFRSCCVII